MPMDLPLPDIPSGTKPLHHQIAGHIYGQGKTKLGCLLSENNLILKPVQRPPKGPRERDFYEKVFDSNGSPVLQGLQKFIPRYYGVYCEKGSDIEYMKLEDITQGFSKPCSTDIKMGAIFYEPGASEEEIKRFDAKWPPAKEIGYQLLGMRVYDPIKQDYDYIDKVYCRSLNAKNIVEEGLAKFIKVKSTEVRNLIIDLLLKKITEIEDWFLSQTEWAFYGCSLFIVHEGDPAYHSQEIADCQSNGEFHGYSSNIDHKTCSSRKNCDLENKIYDNIKGLVDVRMIDFAHALRTDSRDSNYLFGLSTLKKHLHSMKDV